ncbi:MAG: hypothetical protein UY41_C0050G0003 [Candidatus Moranbacteria bacterium GW2011_GWE1_49_15]|nr:MAG: hypothetical protein UX75_C0054G0003 [Candidatus Moranbacteria bacterium GW2011_GWE2_47_10]KKW05479.1 MAG: hypothetical protein UY41_C0050G0003 [Candidatus Moranbacteria bacterium GW2011_GWE1_49_15]HBP01228.1 hypothetical protein [Candidatus Moranbacteria bacterium]
MNSSKEQSSEHLEARLKHLFKKFPGFTDTEIEDVVSKAKERARKEVLLENLFESQIKTLERLGCPKEIVDNFQRKKDKVLNEAFEMSIDEGHIPFLPVIPKSYMGLYALMPMVRKGEYAGFMTYNPNRLINTVKVSEDPYFALDVENGNALLNIPVKDARKKIKSQKRFPLTAEEVVSLGIFTEILSSHNVQALGSCYDCEGGLLVPTLVMHWNSRPLLDFYDPGATSNSWGAGSCGDRI